MACGVGVGVEEEGDEVTDAGEAESHDHGVLGCVDKLVDPAGLEAFGEVNVGGGGGRVAGRVELGELPGVGGDWDSGVGLVVAVGENGVGSVERGGGVGPGVGVAAERH